MRGLLVAVVVLLGVSVAAATDKKTETHNCHGMDESKYGHVQVLPDCPRKPPPGTSKEVIEIVETTITVIFDCDKDPWVTLKPKEQQLFWPGQYIKASEVPYDVLKALNLLRHDEKDGDKDGHKDGDKDGDSKYDPRTNLPKHISGLVAVKYFVEFEQWQIKAKCAEDLEAIIIRVSHAKDVKYIIRDGYTFPTGRNTPAVDMTSGSLRQVLQDGSFDVLSSRQYHLTLTDAVEAWKITRGSKKVVIAVADSGCDVNHPDLRANLWDNPGELPGNGVDDDNNGKVDDVHGYDAATNTNDLRDTEGHGTHVTGTIGAVGNNGIGVTGIMQEASLMCLKILGEGGTDSSNIDAYHYAIRKKARVINNSWGSNPDEPPTPDSGLFQRGAGDFEAKKNLYGPVSREVQRAGIINVWAAGNDGADIDGPLTTMPVSVLAAVRGKPGPVNLQLIVVNTDREDNRNPSSNFGKQGTDLAAPGTHILSTVPTNPSDNFSQGPCTSADQDSCTVDRIYGQISGTSMAAPVVTGAAGLCLFILEPCHLDDDTQITYNCILSTVDKKPQLADITNTGGRLNVRRAVECCAARCKKRKPKPSKKKHEKKEPWAKDDGKDDDNNDDKP